MTVKAGSTTALTVSPTGAVTMSGGFTMGDDLTFTKAAAAITHTGATSFTISSTGTAGTVTVESVVFNGGAVSGVTTLAASDDITLSKAAAAITHTGATSFTISSTGTAGTVTVESVVFNGGAVSGVTTLAASDDITLSKAAAAITHTGATSFTISSTGTAGTVAVESVVFNGGAVSGVTTLATSGTITSVAGDLIIKSDATTTTFSVAAATGNTVVAGTLSVGGAVSGVTTLATSGTITSVAGDLIIKSDAATTKFSVAAATGNTAVAGTLAVTGTVASTGAFSVNTNKFTVAADTGNTVVAGTLAVTGAVTSTGDFAVGANTLTVAAATGNTAVGGTLAVTGTTTIADGTHSGSWGPSSDARWKHSVQNMSRPLDAVMALRPVQFEWNADSPAARSKPSGTVLPSQVGFIAQEVRDALPANVSDSLVFEVDAEGHLAVDYSKFTALLVGAVQEQQHTIAQQQHTIAQHEQDMLMLRSQHEQDNQELRRQLAQLHAVVSELLVQAASGRRA